MYQRFKGLQCNTINDLQSKLNDYKQPINSHTFELFYKYLFKINVPKGTRIPFEITELYFTELYPSYCYIKEFIAFLKIKKTDLNQDQWASFLALVRIFGSKYPCGYKLEDSWPNLFDEFYYSYCAKHNIPITLVNEKNEENYCN